MSNTFDLNAIVRPNILKLVPYRCARDDYNLGILIDANENNFGPAALFNGNLPFDTSIDSKNPLSINRYPDPLSINTKQKFLSLRNYNLSIHNLFIGVGSDEVIDILVRIFCIPQKDKILITPPTYGMYTVVAQINDVGVVKLPLNVENGAFQLQVDELIDTVCNDPLIKIVWLCSPGNPTGTLLKIDHIKKILESDYKGIVVVDEAYIDFVSTDVSMAKYVSQYKNLLVMQTLSKSFGLAGARVGFGISSPEIIQIMNNVKAPYNISTLTQTAASDSLSSESIASMRRIVSEIIRIRDHFLIPKLLNIKNVLDIIGSNDANFVLVRFCNNDRVVDNLFTIKLYKLLADEFQVVVRYRGSELGCEGCLRISIGTEPEMTSVIDAINSALKML
ncbi:hypothetical protein BB561_003257 [Smittium simulii]|uniref:histidinol-phosphate transaminase n=1 Tax=Smittium simulii TaxID=133385 RepID=A0A2T9YMC7_9FUNG|nr:hypothetical protein BB561_003257 [Smittium simulii]